MKIRHRDSELKIMSTGVWTDEVRTLNKLLSFCMLVHVWLLILKQWTA